MAKKNFYITTAIDYVNASPHLGHALEKVQADVIARHHRLLGEEVFFLTGTDEHGRKVAEAAKIAKKLPQVFCDVISKQFRQMAQVLNISNDDFICTSDQKKHWPAVKKVWQQLEKNGDLYKKEYEGLYCPGCEAFITRKDLEDGKCIIHKRKPDLVKEENYFFKLSKYSGKIKKAIEKDEIKIIPAARKNEMLSFLKQGLEDISFSRPRKDLKWGVPVPGDDTQTIYVWSDALVNYLSAIGYAGNKATFEKFWPADIHCIGKDIQKFHCLIWPGMLLSLGLKLPKTIFIHGFISVEGQKMSKSLGNIVDPFELVKKYGTDPVRYFLLRELPPTEDGDFTYEKFKDRYNSDLANGIGNLVARVLKLPEVYTFRFPVSDQFVTPRFNKFYVEKNIKESKDAIEKFKFNESLKYIWNLITFCNKYIEKEKPWERGERYKKNIGNLLFALENIGQTLQPFLPETSEKIVRQLKTRKSEPLFPRL